MEDIKTWRGRDVVDIDGDKIGSLEDIYLDRQSGKPEWAAIRTGLFGTKVSFAPLSDASESGEQVRIAYPKSQVKDAPKIDADGELSPDEEQQLYQHYGRGDYGEWDREGDRTDALADRDEGGDHRFRSERGGEAGGGELREHGRADDDAMTRSEDELHVGTREREIGRGRLRKYVVTENVEQTVPVQREELRVEREPITDANRDASMSGSEITEAEHEVTLHAQEPVVEKRTVPQERVRLGKETVSDEHTVEEDLRKERIDTE